MAVLSRAVFTAALLVGSTACDLGLDPSMVGGGGAGPGASSASSAGGGATTSTTGSSSTTGSGSSSSSSGAGGGGGAVTGGGGAGGDGGAGGGPVVLTACATPDDFESFSENDANDAWLPFNDVEGVNAGDREVRMSLQDGDSALEQVSPSDLEACFASVRFNYQSGPDATFLSFTCDTAVMRYVVDGDTSHASVEFVNPPMTPPSLAQVATPALTNGADLRATFSKGMVTFEVRPMGGSAFTPTHSFAQQAWMDGCRVGFGVTGAGASICRADDFCLDAP